MSNQVVTEKFPRNITSSMPAKLQAFAIEEQQRCGLGPKDKYAVWVAAVVSFSRLTADERERLIDEALGGVRRKRWATTMPVEIDVTKAAGLVRGSVNPPPGAGERDSTPAASSSMQPRQSRRSEETSARRREAGE